MNQMASIAIGATREKAGIDDVEAWRMWTLWMGLVVVLTPYNAIQPLLTR